MKVSATVSLACGIAHTDDEEVTPWTPNGQHD